MSYQVSSATSVAVSSGTISSSTAEESTSAAKSETVTAEGAAKLTVEKTIITASKTLKIFFISPVSFSNADYTPRRL